jgi:hypothetical protein
VAVEGETKRRAGGDHLPPVRVLVARVERRGAIQAVGRGEHRDGPRLRDERHKQGPAVNEAPKRIEDTLAGEAQHRKRLLMTRRVARPGRAVSVPAQ